MITTLIALLQTLLTGLLNVYLFLEDALAKMPFLIKAVLFFSLFICLFGARPALNAPHPLIDKECLSSKLEDFDPKITAVRWDAASQTIYFFDIPTSGWLVAIGGKEQKKINFGLEENNRNQLQKMFSCEQKNGQLDKKDWPIAGWDIHLTDINGDGQAEKLSFDMPMIIFIKLLALYQRQLEALNQTGGEDK